MVVRAKDLIVIKKLHEMTMLEKELKYWKIELDSYVGDKRTKEYKTIMKNNVEETEKLVKDANEEYEKLH